MDKKTFLVVFIKVAFINQHWIRKVCLLLLFVLSGGLGASAGLWLGDGGTGGAEYPGQTAPLLFEPVAVDVAHVGHEKRAANVRQQAEVIAGLAQVEDRQVGVGRVVEPQSLRIIVILRSRHEAEGD